MHKLQRKNRARIFFQDSVSAYSVSVKAVFHQQAVGRGFFKGFMGRKLFLSFMELLCSVVFRLIFNFVEHGPALSLRDKCSSHCADIRLRP